MYKQFLFHKVGNSDFYARIISADIQYKSKQARYKQKKFDLKKTNAKYMLRFLSVQTF